MKSKPPSKKHHRTVMSAFAVTDSKRTAKGKKSSKKQPGWIHSGIIQTHSKIHPADCTK